MDQPLTIVLPMYNNERQLRSSISDLLEVAHAITRALEVVVVDDGSTDDTYEAACELARVYPQVKVLRQPVRSGLASALEMVRDRLAPERVVVHDGVSPIDAAQLRSLLDEDQADRNSVEENNLEALSTVDAAGSRRFASIRTLHRSMETAHRHIVGFSWVQLDRPMIPRRRSQTVGHLTKTAIPILSSEDSAAVFPTEIAPGPIAY